MSDPKTIYLEPICPVCGDANDGCRLWSEDDVWGPNCDECGDEIPPSPVYELKHRDALPIRKSLKEV
jgi:Zn ribbon nucleic-acid-binding protein